MAGKKEYSWTHVYGPVPSRRLGRSLGVDPIPFKTCNFSCVYCQLGRTLHLTNQRQDFFPRREILQEIMQALDLLRDDVDVVTFVGQGEPTLCASLGYLIKQTKEITLRPVAVITNGSLLTRKDVRRELSAADLVMPSLDAASQNVFQKLNRPHGGLQVASIIAGMVEFRRMYAGRLWLEIMLVRGLNDQEEHLKELSGAIEKISPDEVFVNIPLRPPAEGWVKAPRAEDLDRAHKLVGKAILLDQAERGVFNVAGHHGPAEAILQIVSRHPMRYVQILALLGEYPAEAVESTLNSLELSRKVRRVFHHGEPFFTAGEGRYGRRGH